MDFGLFLKGKFKEKVSNTVLSCERARDFRHIKLSVFWLQGKRGIEKQPFQLPDFIAATGIEKIRQVLLKPSSLLNGMIYYFSHNGLNSLHINGLKKY